MSFFICFFFTEAAPFLSPLFIVVFIVVAVLLILTFALVIIYRYKRHKAQGLFNGTNTCTETCTQASTHICAHTNLCCVFPGTGVNRNKNKAAEAEVACEAEVSMQKFKAILVDTRDCKLVKHISCPTLQT